MKTFRKLLAALFCCAIAFAMVPSVAMADGYVAWIGDKGFATLEEAVTAAKSGDVITLGEGKYTLYHKGAETVGKDLTFIGAGTDKTEWGIGAEIPDPDKFGTEYNSDYSFDGAGTITFKNMTMQSGSADYLGFVRADNTVVENCAINGKTFYWGYESATFKDTVFNAPQGDYAIWTYCSPVMTFDGCTFNSSGKTINVYTDGGPTGGPSTYNMTLNYNNCKVISSKDGKAVLNINDSNKGDYGYTINITGTNTVEGLTADDLNKEYTKEQKDISCSRLFEFNTKYGNGNSGRTVVSIDGIKVWENGEMVSHEVDTENDRYTDGYKDDAYDITYGEWQPKEGCTDGTEVRTVTKVCRYCGKTVIETEEKKPQAEEAGGQNTTTPTTGDSTSVVLFALLMTIGCSGTVIFYKKKENR